MREVDNAHHAPNQTQANRDQRKDPTDQNSCNQCLAEKFK
jgi:hypothetical protein